MTRHAIANLQREARLRSFYFSCFEFEVASPDGLEDFQVGYAVDPDGNSLVSERPGDWQKGWIVVARDFLGDPIFTDVTTTASAVFQAPHGEGAWVPSEIAPSFESFAAAVRGAEALAKGRESPAALSANPITQHERQVFCDVISANAASEAYWLGMFAGNDD